MRDWLAPTLGAKLKYEVTECGPEGVEVMVMVEEVEAV